MRRITLAFTKAEVAAKVKSVLIGAGLPEPIVCTSGAAVLKTTLMDASGGVVVLPPRLTDMSALDLLNLLPDTYDLLVIQGTGVRANFDPRPGLTIVDTPLPGAVLADMVSSLLYSRRPAENAYFIRSERVAPEAKPLSAHKRSQEEERLLGEAKQRLMKEQGLTENQAHRQLRKRSMETGIRLIDVASRVLKEGW